ncbi:TlpA family protein disulfide reductase [Promicromonospora sukumoe]|uniref:TlpA family protein disulfide reductase n=1 Tax=Promicromonospora sukumoe TaxID=88382 RepID=UPI000362ADE2|nr:TlpA disulfide reductase family protein [Promicromonospora sukumoe]
MRGKTVKAVQWVVVVGIVLGLVVSLAACSPEDSGAGDVVGQGYVSGDGSVQTYDLGERKGPVAITGTDFEGNDVDSTDWAGDVVVVNTWYASCAPCRAEAPDLVSLAESKDGVRFLGINTEDDAGAAQAFERTFEVPYPSIEDRTGKVIANLQGVVPLQAVPTTVLLDQEGNVAARVIGQAEHSTLESLIDEVLAEAA